MTTHILGPSASETKTLSPTTQVVAAGTYPATTLDAVDPNLKASNIAYGTNIFGITGAFVGTGLGFDFTFPGTGQETSYATGDDKDTAKATSMRAVVDNGDGTLTDYSTGLMWSANGSAMYNHTDGVNYCNNLVLGGYDDWRMPTFFEMMSIYVFDPNSGSKLPDTQMGNYYRTSTALGAVHWGFLHDVNDPRAYYISDSTAYYVRPVRTVTP